MSILKILCKPLQIYLERYPYAEIAVNKDGHHIQRRDIERERRLQLEIENIRQRRAEQLKEHM